MVSLQFKVANDFKQYTKSPNFQTNQIMSATNRQRLRLLPEEEMLSCLPNAMIDNVFG